MIRIRLELVFEDEDSLTLDIQSENFLLRPNGGEVLRAIAVNMSGVLHAAYHERFNSTSAETVIIDEGV